MGFSSSWEANKNAGLGDGSRPGHSWVPARSSCPVPSRPTVGGEGRGGGVQQKTHEIHVTA